MRNDIHAKFEHGAARDRRGPTLEAAILRRGAAALALLASLAVPWAAADAQDGGSPSLRFDGFGTLGLVHSSEDQADFIWNPSRPEGPGHTTSLSPDVDTRLGGQLTFQATPELRAVVQVVSEQDRDDEYTPRVEWANVSYALTPDLSVRAGRTALPVFMISDHRKISYANPWVRPPADFYAMVPFFVQDGLDATYRLHLGQWTGALAGGIGRSKTEYPGRGGESGGYSVETEYAGNVSATVQRGGLTARGAFSTGLLDIDEFDPLFDAFRGFGPEGEALVRRYESDRQRFDFASAGVEYGADRWFTMGELAWVDYHSWLGQRLAGYVTAGHRVGALTPHVTYSRVELLSEASSPGLPLAGLGPGRAAVAAGLNAGLNDMLRYPPTQQTLSLGGRWDYAPGLALQLQVEFVDLLDGSPGTFLNRQPGFDPGGSARIVSLATSFVF